MTLYIIGIGLNDEKDITVKGLEAIKKCDLVYLESYTSIFGSSKDIRADFDFRNNCQSPLDIGTGLFITDINVCAYRLEQYYGKKMIIADRETVESDNNEIIKNAKTKNVALLVVGDPLSATTHIDLFLRANKEGIDCQIIHNASILTAVGITGLQLYKFGKTASIPLKNENIEAPYNILETNKKNGMHTLFLLDMDIENNKFLTINGAIQYLINTDIKKNKKTIDKGTKIIACARIGSGSQIMKYGEIKRIKNIDFGKPPYCLIVPAKLHFMEEEALGMYEI